MDVKDVLPSLLLNNILFEYMPKIENFLNSVKKPRKIIQGSHHSQLIIDNLILHCQLSIVNCLKFHPPDQTGFKRCF